MDGGQDAIAAAAAQGAAALNSVELYLMEINQDPKNTRSPKNSYTAVYSSNAGILPLGAVTASVSGKIVFGSGATVQFKRIQFDALKPGTTTVPASWSLPLANGSVRPGKIQLSGTACGGATMSCTTPPKPKPAT